MTEVNITPFDNEISILYKWARHFRTPIRLVIVRSKIKGEKEETVYTNGIEAIQRLIQQRNNLDQINTQLGEKLETEDIAMIYALRAMTDNLPIAPIIQEINVLYESEGLEIIQDEPELRLVLTDWRNNLAAELQKDLEDLEDLETIQNELARYPEVLYSPIKIDRVTIKASPTLKSTGLPPFPDDGVIMFDHSVPSYDVPYIRYNGPSAGNREELFKLYRGRTDDEMPNYNIIIPPTSQTNKDNSFYMTVWSGKGTLTKATKESYMKGTYDINDNLLTIKTPTEEDINQQTIITKIEQALSININDVTETAISGEFFLFDLDINDIYLVDMIINTELMNSYLFVKETNTPYAEKKQLKIYYKSFSGFVEEEEKVAEGYIVNPSSVTVSLTQNKAQGGEIVMVNINDVPTKFRLPHNLPYVRAKITQAESLDVANRFIKIFSRLMQFYKTEKPNVERLFAGFIPELIQPVATAKPINITVKQPTGKKGSGDSKIERLKEAAPELFVNGYARKCQCIFQPIAIPPDEIEAWQNQTFIYKDTMRQRQIMSFPPENPRWNFVCPNDSAPFPGVKMNKDLSNKEEFPCVPCCFKDDQMDPQVNSNYNECFRGRTKKVEEKTTTKETHKIKTDKILSAGRYGYLPKSISDLLSKYSEEAVDLVRMGVPLSVNSLLHCVSMGVQDPAYMNLQTNDQREMYVRNIRNIIVTQTIPNLLKQEMYDFSDEEIIDQLRDPENFLDPNLFYRAVEQSYNVNIYTFSPPEKEDPASLGSFEIPRYKLFHARSPRPEKRAILVFRTMGAESDSLDYPQCELIVDRDEANNRNIYNFGPNMNNLLQNALSTLNRTITWELTGETNKPKQIIARENIYSRENYYYLLNKLPTRQIVDGYGKTQAFIFPAGDHEITVIIPSTQPENIPTGTVTRVPIEIATGVFGEPRAVTKTDNMVDGLWYQVLDLEFGIYIPIIPTPQYVNKEIGPSNPLVEEGIEVVQRLRKIKRDLETILQIIIWLFLLSKMDVPNFVNRYMSIGKEQVTDSALVYDLSNVALKFPPANTAEEGIAQMKVVAPSLFRFQDRIYLYSQKFFDGILYHLEKYDKERKPLNPKIPTVIHRSDISEEDFSSMRRVAIFTEEADMRTWLNSLDKLSFGNIIIEDKLDISNALRTEPYLYTAPTGNIYMIQNVIGGDKLRALNVAYNWYLHKVNIGHAAPEYEDPQNVPVFVVYGISPALAPIIIENHAGQSMQYLQILSYVSPQMKKDKEQPVSKQYSAMLPLL